MMIKSLAPEDVVSQWVSAFNDADLGQLRQFCSPNMTVHAISPADGVPPGLDRVAIALQAYRAAFPDGRFELDTVYSQGPRLCCRWSARGTNTGSFLGLPSTNTEVVVRGSCQFRFADGIVVEHWFDFNLYDIYEQLGAVLPEPGEGSASSLRVSRGALDAWIRALGAGALPAEHAFADDVVVHASCFQRRWTERGRGALDVLLGELHAALADMHVSVDDCISQGTTSTYRGRMLARARSSPDVFTYSICCMFRTSGDKVTGFWTRIGRRHDDAQ